MEKIDKALTAAIVILFIPLSIWGGLRHWAGPTDLLPLFMMAVALVYIIFVGVRLKRPILVGALSTVVGASLFFPSLIFYPKDFGASIVVVAVCGVFGAGVAGIAGVIERRSHPVVSTAAADLEVSDEVDCLSWKSCNMQGSEISFVCPHCQTMTSVDKESDLSAIDQTIKFLSDVNPKLSGGIALVVAVIIGSIIGSSFGSPPLLYAVIAVLLLPVLKPMTGAIIGTVGAGNRVPVYATDCKSCGKRNFISTDDTRALIGSRAVNP
jgi:hypothetical protein